MLRRGRVRTERKLRTSPRWPEVSSPTAVPAGRHGAVCLPPMSADCRATSVSVPRFPRLTGSLPSTFAQGRAPESSSLPAKPGQCVTTQVASVTSRLEGEPPGAFESGTAINFSNGGHQVSNERESALIASKRGDRVIMCLTAIPRGCPPGDDRGRYYTVTNLRTRSSWSLPDSQHLCGGA